MDEHIVCLICKQTNLLKHAKCKTSCVDLVKAVAREAGVSVTRKPKSDD